ncbi:hypothetical protein D9M71_785310 [compost metagenome]
MIRIDSIWLAIERMDMCAGTGTDTALSRVMAVFGAAKPHCVLNLFANRRVYVNCQPR